MSSPCKEINSKPTGEDLQGPRPLPALQIDKCLSQIREEFDKIREERDMYKNEVAKQIQELDKLSQSVLALEAHYTALRNSYDIEIRRLHCELDQCKHSQISQSSDDFVSHSHGHGHDVQRVRGRNLAVTWEPHVNPEHSGELRDMRDIEPNGDNDAIMASHNPAGDRDALDLSDSPLPGQPPTSLVGGLGSSDSNPVQDRNGERGGKCSRKRKQGREQEVWVSLPEFRLITPPMSMPPMPLSNLAVLSGKFEPAPASTNATLPSSNVMPEPCRSTSLSPAPSTAPGHTDTNSFTSPRSRSLATRPSSECLQDASNSMVTATFASSHESVATPPNSGDMWTDSHNVPPGPEAGLDCGWVATSNLSASQLHGCDEQLSSKRNLGVQQLYMLEHDSTVCCVQFSPNGKYLATGSQKNSQIYCTKTGQKVCMLEDTGRRQSSDPYIRSICFHPEGNYLATGDQKKQIKLWDIHSRKIQARFPGHEKEVLGLDFSRDGLMLVSGSSDATVRIWNVNIGNSYQVLTTPRDTEDAESVATCVRISPDGRFVVAASLDKVVRIWDIRSGELVESLRGHSDSVYSVAYTPDGKGIVSGSFDSTLKYWDVRLVSGAGSIGQVGSGAKSGSVGERGSKCMKTFTGHKSFVLSVAVSADSKCIASGSKDSTVQLWDMETGISQCKITAHINSVISVDLSHTENVLATGSGDKRVGIWKYM